MKNETRFQKFDDISFEDEVNVVDVKDSNSSNKEDIYHKEENAYNHQMSSANTRRYNDKQLEEAKDVMYYNLLSFMIRIIIALLCFLYCYFYDASYREMTTTWLFGEHEVLRVNWWWWLWGIVFIVFGIKAYNKYDDLKSSYKKYKSYK